MQVQDDRARLGGGNGRIGDLVGSHRQMRRHAGGVDGSGGGAGDDDFAGLAHE
jgi:hypothetical protein